MRRTGNRSLPPAGNLADATAPNEVHDAKQDDGTDQRHQKALDSDALIDRPAAENQTGDKGADDADDDIEQNSLLRVGAHHHAGKPADNSAHDKPN